MRHDFSDSRLLSPFTPRPLPAGTSTPPREAKAPWFPLRIPILASPMPGSFSLPVPRQALHQVSSYLGRVGRGPGGGAGRTWRGGPTLRGRRKSAGPMRRGLAAQGWVQPAPLPPHLPAPPRLGLKPCGLLVAALRALRGARRCDWVPRRRHHAPPARAGPGRALPAGAARRRRRRLLRVSARRAPARLPPPPPSATRPTFPFRWPRPRRDLELRP